MAWKKVLYDYVNAKNQAELEGSIEPFAVIWEDPAYLHGQHTRIQQRAIVSQERGAQSLRNETKLRLKNVQITPCQVVVDIELHRVFDYRIRLVQHTEERIEVERVTLVKYGANWKISRIEATQSEKSALEQNDATHFYEHESEWPASYRSPSIPYMNYSILNKKEALPRKIQYDRAKAVQYAETWWNQANPKYIEFAVDCTSFVSQSLYAGGAPMDYTGKRQIGWWYTGKQGKQELWSFSWAVAHSLQSHISLSRKGLRGLTVASPQDLWLGDIISYDWDGNGRYEHNTIVTSKDANGMPLVNAHTYNCRNRFWDYRDSPAYSERTRYVFVHIADEM
jgi:hypothetical protein